jgi:hypothetical protein
MGWSAARLLPKRRPAPSPCSRAGAESSSSTAPLRGHERPGGASNHSTSTGASTTADDGASCGAARRTNTHVSGAPTPSTTAIVPSGFLLGLILGGRSDNGYSRSSQ